MTSLLHRLQSLTGPDREVDGKIALAVGWRQLSHDLWRNGDDIAEEPPRYTESLDAAKTCLAPGARWGVETWPDGGFQARVGHVFTHGETDAIALLIAWAKMMESDSALSGKEE